MKRKVLVWMAVATAAAVGNARADDTFDPGHAATAALYFKLPLGGTTASTPRYGLRLSGDAYNVLDDGAAQSRGWQSVPLVDLHFGREEGELHLFGARTWDSSSGFGTGDSFKKPMFWVGAAILGLGVSCLTDNFPCDEDDDDDDDEHSTPGLQ